LLQELSAWIQNNLQEYIAFTGNKTRENYGNLLAEYQQALMMQQ
jgi:hypothetical protein